jgi:integrase
VTPSPKPPPTDRQIARLKDLRDTYASQLLTCEVSFGYVSAQLEHADVSVTARHYARWVESDFYRVPLVLEPGEVPADFLARLPKSPHLGRDDH